MLAFPFAVKFKLLIAGLLLASALPGRSIASVIDSTQWPFPLTLLFSFSTAAGRSHYSNGSLLYSEECKIDEPSDPGGNGFTWSLTWRDVLAVDSAGWHIQLGQKYNSAGFLIVLDSTIGQVKLLHYNDGISDGPGGQGSCDVVLRDLFYDSLGFHFADNDVNRHVVSGTYTRTVGHSNDYTVTGFGWIHNLSIFSQTLIIAFAPPILVNFGPMQIGQTRDTEITLHNLSTAPFRILSYSLTAPDSGFTFVDTSLRSIAARDSGTITIRLSPTKRQAYSGSIKILTDEQASNSYTIGLTGSVPPLQSVAPELRLESLIQVSPNPTTDHATLRITAASDLEAVTLRIYDAAARLVRTQDVGHLSEGEHEIPITLPTMDGMVFVRITAGGAVIGTLGVAVTH